MEPILLSEISACLKAVYAAEAEGRPRQACRQLFHYIESNFAESSLYAVDGLLELVEVEKLSTISISGLLRCTCRANRYLPSWEPIFLKAKELLAARGENVESLFRGLKPYK